MEYPAHFRIYSYFEKTEDREKSEFGGNLIEGHVKVTKFGPRIFWKKHKLSDMPMGYGG